MTYSLPRACTIFCGRFIIAVNGDNLYGPKQGKLASACLQRFPSIFETSISVIEVDVEFISRFNKLKFSTVPYCLPLYIEKSQTLKND